MANFLTAHRLVMGNEGGYANDPNDHGGETYKGISRNNFPDWTGWLIIDDYKKKYPDSFKNLLQYDLVLEGKVLNFYRSNFWNTIMGDQIVSQNTADSIYDSAVNMGVRAAIKLTQDTLFNGTLNGIDYGKMDQKTLNALNNIV